MELFFSSYTISPLQCSVVVAVTSAKSAPACEDLFLLLPESLYLWGFYRLFYMKNQHRKGVLSFECNQFQWEASECLEYTKRMTTW